MENKKPKTLVSVEERSAVARAVRQWLNSYPEKPCKRIDYEYLAERGMTLSTIQAPYKTRQFIDGSYQAQYQFNIVYRVIPTTADERLDADEVLDKMGEWCEQNKPTLGDKLIALKVECSTNSTLVARFEDNTEDHQISLNLTYEVINNG